MVGLSRSSGRPKDVSAYSQNNQVPACAPLDRGLVGNCIRICGVETAVQQILKRNRLLIIHGAKKGAQCAFFRTDQLPTDISHVVITPTLSTN